MSKEDRNIALLALLLGAVFGGGMEYNLWVSEFGDLSNGYAVLMSALVFGCTGLIVAGIIIMSRRM